MMPARSILVLQGDPDEAFLLRLALGRAALGTSITFLASGLQTLAYIAGDSKYANRRIFPIPDLVLLDLDIQPLSGIEVLAWVRQLPLGRNLPIVSLSSLNEPALVRQARSLGANFHLFKPATLRQVSATARSLRRYWSEIAGARRPPNLHSMVPASREVAGPFRRWPGEKMRPYSD